jgi:chromate transporter
MCRILPGANQVNMAVFVGMKLRGVPGAIASVVGLIAIPMVIVLAAGALYLQFRDVPALKNLMRGMAAGAVGLTLSVAWRQGRHILAAPVPLLLFVISVGMAAALRAPLWLTLLLLGPVGFWWAWRRVAAS